MHAKSNELDRPLASAPMATVSWGSGERHAAGGRRPGVLVCVRSGGRGGGSSEPAKGVAEDRAFTHAFPVSEAYAGMMVTPSVRLVRPLGEGGMGAVWVADHLALRTQVVVKFIASSLKDSKEATERFSREAAAAAQVKSPHVVQTFDHGVSPDGVPYIVMELLEGRDLGDFLDAEGRCPPELALEIVTQLARALDRAHERGIVHRDIKPGNIFLCDGGRGEVFVKLLDFGIAKGVEVPRIDSTTKTGSMIGSPFYMSPEQILGAKDLDHRSDLWSVGVVAYEALTGKKPFDAETMGGLAIRIHSEPLPVPSSVEPSLPPAVDAWFQRACARQVGARFSNAKELADALAVALGRSAQRSTDLPPSSPRSNGSPSMGAVEAAPTLLDGATTEAGIVRSAPSGRTRNRVVALLASAAVLFGATAFLASHLRRSGASEASGLVAEPVTAAPAQVARTSALPAAAMVAEPAEPTSPPSQGASATAEPTSPPSASAEPTAPAPPTTKAAAHAGRPVHRPTAPPPSPPSASAAPAPAPTGHDIF